MADEKTGHQAVGCSNCGYEFPHQPGEPASAEVREKPCPRCGHTSKTYGIKFEAVAEGKPSMSRTVGKNLSADAEGTASIARTVKKTFRVISVGVASISWERTREGVREYRERHPVWFIANIVLVVGPPFLGSWIAGKWGVVVGLVLGVLGAWVGGKASTKVREITREITRGGDQ